MISKNIEEINDSTPAIKLFLKINNYRLKLNPLEKTSSTVSYIS